MALCACCEGMFHVVGVLKRLEAAIEAFWASGTPISPAATSSVDVHEY